MKTYDKYKQSGIEWIGEIPEHWEKFRLAYNGRFYKGKGVSKSDLSIEGHPVILYGDIYTKYNRKVKNIERFIPEKIASGSFPIYKGDLLFTASGETPDEIGKCIFYDSEEDAYAGGDSIIFRQNRKNSNFLSYLLNSYKVNEQKAKLSKGDIVVHIYSSQLRDISFPLPPLQEQTAIADYLDLKTAEIDELITDKKRLLELYEEEKTAVINQAVTKGIDPNVKMKDSGIEWLGEIPEHWEVKRLKYMARVQTGRTPKIQSSDIDFFENGEVNWFTPSDFERNNELKGSNRKINNEAIETGEVELFPEYSVYLVSIGATLGKVSYFKEKASANQQINIISFIEKKYNPVLGYYYLVGKVDMITLEADFTTLPILNQSKTKNLTFVVPPLDVQQQIVDFIEKEMNRINTKIDRTKKLIELLKEYRTALISEVVTGKVKVVD